MLNVQESFHPRPDETIVPADDSEAWDKIDVVDNHLLMVINQKRIEKVRKDLFKTCIRPRIIEMSGSKLCIYLWKRWIWPTHTPPQIKNLQADDKYKQEPTAQTAFLPSKFPAIPWDGRIPKPGRRRWGNGRIWATQHRLRGPKTIEVSY